MGKTCKFLISTLKDRKIYGDYKSSGTFGDAIFLKKPMIAPIFSDPKKEFSSFCFYYKNKKNFQKLLKKLVNKKINYSFAKFQAQSNLKRVEKELNL